MLQDLEVNMPERLNYGVSRSASPFDQVTLAPSSIFCDAAFSSMFKPVVGCVWLNQSASICDGVARVVKDNSTL